MSVVIVKYVKHIISNCKIKMKIICKDNYDRATRNDKLIALNVDPFYGKTIVDFLNSKTSAYSPDFFTLVEDDYKLYVFEP